jgi:DNA-binding NtrC family response regulator
MQTERILIASANVAEAFLIPLSRSGVTVAVGDRCTIGRDPACEVVLADPFVSHRHVRIERRGGSFMLRDLQSRNGTFLNGTKIVESALTIGDKLKIGESVFIFSESPAEGELTSKNVAWNEQLRRLPAFASTDFPVLITGPSGSGKEILSRALHQLSPRAKGEFVGLNCSALSESLIESELFGHLKGSFTGATGDRKGAFEAARGGTLFLDEIGDLPLSLQPKLLRAIEASEIRPVGSDKAISTDVRIVAATHKNIVQAIREGRFREDLYYRLNVCHIRPPALRERLEDFDELLYAFAKQFRVRFSFNAIAALKQHPWNGNIRELKNVIARASAYYPGANIQPDDLQAILEPPGTTPEVHFTNDPFKSASSSIIKELEREIIVRRLVANQGNQRRTAKDLGMAKSTLHDRIKNYSIDVKQILDPEALSSTASGQSI